MYKRELAALLRVALQDTPVVLLLGARQVGKSTLVQAQEGRRYLTLDTLAVRAAAGRDPEEFLRGLGAVITLDEVSRVPEVLLAIKAAVDEDRRPGRFLLTGSANVLQLPRVADSLAGRMEILTLWPLSQAELEAKPHILLEALFDPAPLPNWRGEPLETSIERLLIGGYPEVQSRTPARRLTWFRSYLQAILERDVQDLARIEGLRQLPDLLKLLAARHTTLSNDAELSRASTLPLTTLKRYLALLEAVYLIHQIPAWSQNFSKRLVKSPKRVLSDSGLVCHLLGVDRTRLLGDPKLLGFQLEGFVLLELIRQLSTSSAGVRLYHYRTEGGSEVDALLEAPDGRITAIEVKSSSAVTAHDFRHLSALQSALGNRFVRGVVLYTGEHTLPFGPGLSAVPLTALWETPLSKG